MKWILAVLLLILVGCSKPADKPSAAQPSNRPAQQASPATESRVTRSNPVDTQIDDPGIAAEVPSSSGIWQWQNEEPRQDEPGTRLLPSSHIVSVELNLWLNVLHSTLVKKYPEIYGKIPKPVVRLSLEAAETAYAKAAIVCHEKPVRLGFAEYKGGAEAEVAVLMPASKGGKKFHLVKARRSDCVTVSRDETALALALQRSQNKDSSCIVKQKNNALIFSTECLSQETVTSSEVIGYPTASNLITFTLPLLVNTENEAQAVAILYHEAAHYYGAHVTIGRTNQINYFYDQKTYSGLGRPEPQPKLDALGLEALQVGDALRLKEVPNQIYSSAVGVGIDHFNEFYGIKSQKEQREACARSQNNCNKTYTIENVCEGRQECLSKCDAFAGLVENFALKEVVADWNFNWDWNSVRRVFSKPDEDLYLKAETAFQQCAKEIRFYNYSEKPKKGVMTLGWAELAVGKPPGEARISLQNGATLADYVKALSEFDVRARKLLKTSAEARLGFHTTEEEADRLSIQYLDEVGIDPSAAAEVHIVHLKQLDKLVGKNILIPSIHDIGESECKKLRKNSWKAPDGNDVYLPVGDFSDHHHGACFRIKGLDANVRALKPKNRGPLLTRDSKSWLKFLKEEFNRQKMAMIFGEPSSKERK